MPNIVYEIAAGGILAAVVVPLVAHRIATVEGAGADRESADDVAPALLTRALAVLLPLTAARRRSLEVLEIDADVAGALGASPQRDSAVLIALAVGLAALATAAAGPIAFIAFVSGPLSRLLLRGRPSLVAAGATGAALTLLADGVAQLLPLGPYPVGIVTGAAGAPFLLWVLLRRSASGAAA